ncbi:complex 1 protein-like protein [Bimuria novae-zelandiae CBS 107.79]|uniref:Complex 1 protein-like protein n=1 Tax=Bimuria novae-zelandiae CBS 107.79 TaxID=1447943 RepID=A0A6A5VDW0_9PLEO|nr:complex 1 protein-like protein [Bimuria novae-zelandiae CBS 107.79]
MARLTGLQKDVLSLYRQCLRAARRKPAENREHFRALARSEFSKYGTVDRKDFNTIEYLLRRGRRQLDMYGEEGVRDVKG